MEFCPFMGTAWKQIGANTWPQLRRANFSYCFMDAKASSTSFTAMLGACCKLEEATCLLSGAVFLTDSGLCLALASCMYLHPGR